MTAILHPSASTSDAAEARLAADGADGARLQAAVDQVVAATLGSPLGQPLRQGGALGSVLATERYQRAALDVVPEAWVFLRSVRDDSRRVVDFVVIDLNAAGERLAGRPRSAVIGGSLGELFPFHRQGGLFEWYASVAETGLPVEGERCVYSPDGDEQWLHINAVPIPGGVAVSSRDVTDRRRADAARARLAAILEETPDIVSISGIDGRIEYLNGAGRAMLGLPPRPAPDGRYDLTVADVQPQLLPNGTLASAVERAAQEGVWRGETVLRKRDGREVPVEQVLIAHFGADGRPTYFSSVMRDITDRKHAEAALRSLSLMDDLTGLYNRRGFLTVAGQAIARAREAGAPVLVFYLDVDEFKQINDQYGHAIGDDALRTCSDVLRATFRESDVIGRLGGDEFVAFAVHGVGMDSDAIARAVAARLAQRLDAASARAGCYALRVSMGIARESNTLRGGSVPQSLDALLAAADLALYEEKSRRKAARVWSATDVPDA